MSEHPILFSGPMVRAILAGTKRQTRRLVKLRPGWGFGPSADPWPVHVLTGDRLPCPFGAPGDVLWVKETFGVWHREDATPGGRPYDPQIVYRADNPDHEPEAEERAAMVVEPWRWRPSIFMPRRASRLSLAVESIRVERVQAISEADIAAEGVTPAAVRALWDGATRKQRDAAYIRELGRIDLHPPHEWWRVGWKLLHGRESWDADPFVWCVGFRRADVRAP